MSEAPLPQPRDPLRVEAVADVLACVSDEKTAVYVSVPITSGKRFLEWFETRGNQLDPNSRTYRDELLKSVIRPNCEDIAVRIAKIREQLDGIVINPAAFERPEWTQDDYRYFWGYVIDRFAKIVLFLNGWHFSSGCAYEFLRCTRSGIRALAENGAELSREQGINLIDNGIAEIESVGAPKLFLERVFSELLEDAGRFSGKTTATASLESEQQIHNVHDRNHFKDAVLDELATIANIAQFVSFGPDDPISQRFARVHGFPPNHLFATPEDAVAALLEHSPDGTVNVRSYRPEHPTGEPLVYGLKTVDAVMTTLRQKVSEKFYTIVNETIDVGDGGVSGVALGDLIEFAPQATPQCVDQPGICALPRGIALRLLQQVYGFRPALNYNPETRVEFSIHPRRRGLCNEHTIIWEIEHVGVIPQTGTVEWRNNFSRFIGEKTFGLLLADTFGLLVPRTTTITRHIAPFTFGQETGTVEIWMRTAPEVRAPGLYPTTYGWTDPFVIIAECERNRSPAEPRIAAVLAQESVSPEFSGAAIPRASGHPVIEGVQGRGDEFMIGKAKPSILPEKVRRSVLELYLTIKERLGTVELEWVYDGKRVWIVQIHASQVSGDTDVIFPGNPDSLETFEVERGLEALRSLIPELVRSNRGLLLVGNVGITSHFGDLLRRARVPSRIQRRR